MKTTSPSSYDEMLNADGSVRPAYAGYCGWYDQQPPDLLRRKGSEAEAVAVSMTVVRQAMESAQGLLSQNAMEDSRFKQSASLNRMQIRSVLCAPLVSQDGTAIGVIQIVTRGATEIFNNDDLDLLVSVASQAALAIENAELHEQLLLKREFESIRARPASDGKPLSRAADAKMRRGA